jgi:hypothetical protein
LSLLGLGKTRLWLVFLAHSVAFLAVCFDKPSHHVGDANIAAMLKPDGGFRLTAG